MSLTACDSSNFHPSPENWFTFDETTNTITGFSENWDGTTDITIPCSINGKGVKEIGQSALPGKSLTSVVIGDSVKKIGQAAFPSNNLSKLVLGNRVEEIGIAAFNTNKFTNIVIPDSVNIIEQAAFSSNQVEATLSLGKNVKIIGYTAFNQSNLVGKLELPNSIESIGQAAFENDERRLPGHEVQGLRRHAASAAPRLGAGRELA